MGQAPFYSLAFFAALIPAASPAPAFQQPVVVVVMTGGVWEF